MTSIYDRIWASDLNGCIVTHLDEDGNALVENADIVLNEQVKASGKRNIDLASQPLFHYINPGVLERPTYQAFISLLDNFVTNTRIPEVVTQVEEAEIDSFMSMIMQTEPMRVAFKHITESLGLSVSEEQFLIQTREMWFKIYTNYYRGRSTHHCSGFEHVYVGEGKFSPRDGSAETLGEISGYHSWLKFYLDEISGRVNYLGYKYDLGGEGNDQPIVVTLQMIWNHQSIDGTLVAELFKKKGGFFVGRSPECEMALGTVAMYESMSGVVSGDRIPVNLNGGFFNLVMYRNFTEDGKRGNYIRSFYPEYLGRNPSDNEIDVAPINRTTVRPIQPDLINNGKLRVSSALPNPPGEDTNGEWVEITNVSEDTVDLSDFEIRDKMSRPKLLNGQLDSGASLRIELSRDSNNSMQLGNSGGYITLHENTRLIAAVVYGRAEEGAVLFFNEDGSLES